MGRKLSKVALLSQLPTAADFLAAVTSYLSIQYRKELFLPNGAALSLPIEFSQSVRLVASGAGPFAYTLNLPAPGSDGISFVVRHPETAALPGTVNFQGSTVDGLTSLVLQPGEWRQITSYAAGGGYFTQLRGGPPNNTVRYIGNPADKNVAYGVTLANTTFDPSCSGNNLFGDHNTVSYGVYASGNTVHGTQYYCTYGPGFADNFIAGYQIQNAWTRGSHGNYFGPNVANCRGSVSFSFFAGQNNSIVTGDDCTNLWLGPGTARLTMGARCKAITTGPNVLDVTLGDDCRFVEIYDCHVNADGTPFAIPPGTSHAVYRNNALAGIGGTGIDYANPVTLTAAATLEANKAYYVTGAGYTLTLPAAAENVGKAIFIEIAPNATGLYPVAGAGSLALYANETMAVRGTTSGTWKSTGGQLLPMTAELQTALSQQTSVTSSGGQAVTVPFTVAAEASGPAGLVDAAGARLVVQRAGRAALRAAVNLKNVDPAYGYGLYLSKNGQFIASANLPVGSFGDLLAIGEVTKTAHFAAGDVLSVAIYTTGPGNYRGTYEGSQAIFSFTEVV